MQHRTEIRFANFLSPLLHSTYASIASYIEASVGRPTRLQVGQSLEEFASEQIDIGFLCGLLYVHLSHKADCLIELLAAPVLRSARYQEKPIYFSDVVVRRDSQYTSFEDLAGCTWAYNECSSHSGYNLVQYSLLKRGKSASYFGSTLQSGSHLNSLRLVMDGEADAAAIDSHILDVVLQRDAEVAARIRVIDMLGPSAIPPMVVAKGLEPALKRDIQMALVTMHQDPLVVRELHKGFIDRFVLIKDENYQDICHMFECVQAATMSPPQQLKSLL